MPWNVSGVLDKREEFLAEYVSGDWTMSELCGMYRVMQHGQFFWNYNAVFLGKVLAGQSIGLLPIDDRCLRIDLGWYPVARFDRHTLRVEKLRPEDCTNDTCHRLDDYGCWLNQQLNPKKPNQTLNHVPGPMCKPTARLDTYPKIRAALALGAWFFETPASLTFVAD